MASDSSPKHIPVLAEETLELITPAEGRRRIIDCTVGYAGHSSLILKKNREAELLGIDRDGDALAEAERNLQFAAGRFRLVRGDFSRLKDHAAGTGWCSADAILMDLGVSSPQIDTPRRGFSWRHDGPLDMRMDTRCPAAASRILNSADAESLERIFRDYGEIGNSRLLAAKIIERRAERPWTTTGELAELCAALAPRHAGRRGPPAPTLIFQALRIAVNDELGELERALPEAAALLAPGGVLAVISFHSLEDRIVKNFFRRESSECLCPPGLPVCVCGHKPALRLITKKPVTASPGELERNPRSAPAKLRAAVKI
jgi:16S rRNA (cytosine1402-N4)-methyltransferase